MPADVDNPGDSWQAVAAGAATTNGYGSYALSATGVWTYTLDNSNATVQALNVGDPPLTDSFTVLTADGTAQVVTITITGANDAAVISGATTGQRDGGRRGRPTARPDVPTATGDLNSTDVDNPPDAWQAVAAGAATTNGFGSYALSATGVWTYTLDNSNPDVQALNGIATLTDSFTALTADGTAQVVTITITGANDAAVISGTATGAVTEAGGVEQRHARNAHRHRRSQCKRCRQSRRQLAGGSGRRRHLRQLRAVSDRGVDLHARQQQRRRCRRSTSAILRSPTASRR